MSSLYPVLYNRPIDRSMEGNRVEGGASETETHDEGLEGGFGEKAG